MNAGLVAHTLRADGFDASEDGTGRGTPLVPVCFDPTQITSGENRSNPQPGDPCHTLAKGAHAPAIAFAWQAGGGETSSGAFSNELSPTLPKNQTMAVQQSMQVRRLTPTECERLMGFPPIAERIIFTICIDPQNHYATVALRCLRWPSSASPADGEGLPLFACTAEVDSSIRQAGQGVLAALYAQPLSDGSAVQLHSRARSGSSASGASAHDLSRRQALDGATAHSLAHTLRELAHSIRSGKAASPLSMLLSTAASSGSVHALMSGAASVVSASGVSSDRSSGTFTTSELGRLAPISASREATLCCSVMAAIGGFIPEETLPGCFSLEATVLTPYTAITWRGKPAADGPRYKALGNSWATNCARWVGRRIQLVDQIRGQQ